MDNVEVVRAVLQPMRQSDAAAVLARYDPQVVWDISRGPLAQLTGAGVYHGHEGVRAFLRSWREAWEDPEYVVDELAEAGEYVLSVGRMRGRGRVSGLEFEGAGQAALWEVRDGRIVRVVWFGSREEALAAASA